MLKHGHSLHDWYFLSNIVTMRLNWPILYREDSKWLSVCQMSSLSQTDWDKNMPVIATPCGRYVQRYVKPWQSMEHVYQDLLQYDGSHVAQLIEHGACNTRAVGSTPMGNQYKNVWTHYSKSLWIRASAKWLKCKINICVRVPLCDRPRQHECLLVMLFEMISWKNIICECLVHRRQVPRLVIRCQSSVLSILNQI